MTVTNQAKQIIPFFELTGQMRQLKAELESAFSRVVESGNYILGGEVAAFEKDFAQYIGARFAVGVASGTDALTLSLRAVGIGAGDEVITVANTAVPTVVAISQAGATPVFVDIEKEGFHMDPSLIAKRITPRTKAILPVHLYGQTVSMDTIVALAQKHGIPVIEDACQAHGAKYGTKTAGNIGLMGCFSFYPTKNLGGVGDGGMITLNNQDLYENLLLLRNYGQKSKYEHVSIGFNSRLDELQAAILRIKLKHLDRWNQRRMEIAKLYLQNINNESIKLPPVDECRKSVYHQFVIRTSNRDQLQSWLNQNGVGTLIHYPTPVHLQKAYAFLKVKNGDLPRSESHCHTVLSLPSYPELTDEQVLQVCKLINDFKG